MVIAPARAQRPGAGHTLIEAATREEHDECPFCRGREDRTPPETLRLPNGAEQWVVRVVPNLYPAIERQEVVIHSAEHKRSFAELTDEEIELTARAWHARAQAALDDGFSYPLPLINEGRTAGSSLAHSHSQIVFLRKPPPAANEEVRQPTCGVCEVRKSDELVIAEDNGVEAIVHPAGRLPYELLLAQAHADLDLTATLRLVRLFLRKLHAIEGPVPWNAWLHHMYQGERGPHVHMEVVPRLTVIAGLELGAGIYVNSLDPAEAADRLRSTDATPPGRAGA